MRDPRSWRDDPTDSSAGPKAATSTDPSGLGPARPGAWQPPPPADDQRALVTFDAHHICGATHRVTGWPTAAPGLVVFRDGPPNTPCGQASFVERWHIWQLPHEYVPGKLSPSCLLAEDFGDPESAMHEAGRIGQLRAGQLTLDDLQTVVQHHITGEPPFDWVGP